MLGGYRQLEIKNMHHVNMLTSQYFSKVYVVHVPKPLINPC